MKPYYERGGIVIYHGDCREVLPGLVADACITDPPYGLNFRDAEWDASIPEWIELARKAAPIVIFTTAPLTLWAYERPDWLLCWARPASSSRSLLGGFNHWTPVVVYGKPRFPVDLLSLHAIAHATPGRSLHPSPKPVALLTWLISNATNKGGTVLDPFMGSGTTLRAAKDLGRKAIGIEIEERYCEIAARRLAQEVLPL